MKQYLQRWLDYLRPHPGWFVLLAAVGLVSMGIAAIATVPILSANQPNFADQQVRWLPIALGVMLLCMIPHPKQIGLLTYPAMFAVVGLLLITVLPFMPVWLVPVRNGARQWINLQFMMLQPSELAKLVFILALARYLRHRQSYRTLPGLLVPFGIMFIPLGLILLQPDVGTALLFPPVLFAVLAAAGARFKHIGSLLAIGLILLSLVVGSIFVLPDSMQVLRKHQRQRIEALVSQVRGESRYLSGVGYQQYKAMTLIGSGQARGLGREQSQAVIRYNWLPEAHNDMIFPVVVNRWGWIGGMTLLGLLSLLMGSLFWVAGASKDPFIRLSCVGFAVLLTAQAAINLGMALGLFPIVGITLPLVSYGGSSLVATFMLVGLSINFAAQRPPIFGRPSFEFNPTDD